VLVVLPTCWDGRQLDSCRERWADRLEIEWAGPSDADCPASFDALGFVESTVAAGRGRIAGVLSSSDYPGATVAAAIATRLGLPGADPGTVIRCSH
jgi:hypothetical protein